MAGNGPFPPRPPFGSQHPTHSQLSAPAGPGSRRGSLGGGSSSFLPNFARVPSDENRNTSYSLGGSDGGPSYPASGGPHSDSGPHARGSHDNQVQSIVNLNTLGLNPPSSWDGNPILHSENSGGAGAVTGGYITPRGLGSVGRASSAPLAQPSSQENNTAQGAAASARPKRRRRNEQQQVNNKLAQQRYREKQKMKTRELESQVEELTAQVKALETSSGRSRELMQENEMLRTQHQQLRVQIDKLNVRTMPTPCTLSLSLQLCLSLAAGCMCLCEMVITAQPYNAEVSSIQSLKRTPKSSELRNQHPNPPPP